MSVSKTKKGGNYDEYRCTFSEKGVSSYLAPKVPYSQVRIDVLDKFRVFLDLSGEKCSMVINQSVEDLRKIKVALFAMKKAD